MGLLLFRLEFQVSFKDKRVRQAMSYAFNHQELLEKHRFGMDEASTGIFHRTSPWAPR